MELLEYNIPVGVGGRGGPPPQTSVVFAEKAARKCGGCRTDLRGCTRLRGRIWAMSSQTWPRRREEAGAVAIEEAAGRPRGTTSLTRSSEGQREWKRGRCSFGPGHGTAERDVASANEATRTSAGHVAAVRRGARGGARPAAAGVATRWPARRAPRTKGGEGGRDRVADEAAGRLWGSPPRTRPQDCRGSRLAQ